MAYPDWHVIHEYKVVGRRSGIECQVDVWGTGLVGPHEVNIAVECRCYQGRVGIKDVEAFYSFLDDVGANKGVIISDSGFTSGARSRVQATHALPTGSETVSSVTVQASTCATTRSGASSPPATKSPWICSESCLQTSAREGANRMGDVRDPAWRRSLAEFIVCRPLPVRLPELPAECRGDTPFSLLGVLVGDPGARNYGEIAPEFGPEGSSEEPHFTLLPHVLRGGCLPGHRSRGRA